MLLPKLQTRVDPTHEAFQCLTPIFDDVPTIHHLFGIWCAFARSTSILPATISTDPLDARMGAKPRGFGLCGPIREQIDRTMPLPVNEERTIFLTATKREIINAKNRRGSLQLHFLGDRWL